MVSNVASILQSNYPQLSPEFAWFCTVLCSFYIVLLKSFTHNEGTLGPHPPCFERFGRNTHTRGLLEVIFAGLWRRSFFASLHKGADSSTAGEFLPPYSAHNPYW